jgi:hypothetical protein
MNTIDVEEIITAVCAYFDPKNVFEAKLLLHELSKLIRKDNRRAPKIKEDVSDIIKLFQESSTNNINLPKFVADTYDAFPPVKGFNELSRVILSFMNRIDSLEQEMKKTREDNLILTNNIESVVTLHQEMIDIKANTMILLERNAPPLNEQVYEPPMDSFPPLPAPQRNLSVNTATMATALKNPPVNRAQVANSAQATNGVATTGAIQNITPGRRNDRSPIRRRQSIDNRNRHEEQNDQRASRKNLDIYVGRCPLDINFDDVIYHCERKIGISVLECIELDCKIQGKKSFKITVNASDRDSVLRSDKWPLYVNVRKFYSPRERPLVEDY